MKTKLLRKIRKRFSVYRKTKATEFDYGYTVLDEANKTLFCRGNSIDYIVKRMCEELVSPIIFTYIVSRREQKEALSRKKLGYTETVRDVKTITKLGA